MKMLMSVRRWAKKPWPSTNKYRALILVLAVAVAFLLAIAF